MKRALAFGGLCLVLSASLWTVVSWPLVRYVGEGIPASPLNPVGEPPRRMIAGDHLQLLYQLWLAHDTWFGPTPWSHNLYEFNTGDDAARRVYNTYYFPFNLFYGIGRALQGDALGWNLAAILSLAISLGATRIWIRRWVRGGSSAMLWGAALLGQCLPYRWHTLLNGSPTGLSLMWVPVILLGLDLWLRDRRRTGAFLAGAAVFLSGWSDSHVFFFGALLCVGWMPANLLAVRPTLRISWADLRQWAITGWPLALWAALTLLQVVAVKASLHGTNNQSGRKTAEVALFSPPWSHAVDGAGAGGLRETYLGYGWIFLLAVCLGLLLVRALLRREREEGQRLGLFLFTVMVLLLCSLIATGPANPWGPRRWEQLTRLLPPLGMLRQPAKIYLLFPPLISLCVALGLSVLPRRASLAAAGAVLLLLGADWTRRIQPHICLLDADNAAYAAAAEGLEAPRALVLPLWPGDSHWSSLYLHYAKAHRIRLVNGYRPSLNLAYVQEIFEGFQSFNQGGIAEEQLDDLLRRGINRLLFHENAFPEKVSPFAAGRTLRVLLTHPRLRFLKRDGPIWAFAISDTSHAPSTQIVDWIGTGSVRLWNPELSASAAERPNDPDAYKGGYVHLADVGETRLTAPFSFALTGHELLWIRARGPGRCDIELHHGDEVIPYDFDLGPGGWRWVAIEPPARPGTLLPFHLAARRVEGTVDIDVVHLTADDWAPHPDLPLRIPAIALFRAGHSDPDTGEVHFLPGRDPADFILYGPNLPLEKGAYRVELEFSANAPTGTVLGVFRLRGREEEAPVVAGQPAVLTWEHPGNEPWNTEFRFRGTVPVTIRGLRLDRR